MLELFNISLTSSLDSSILFPHPVKQKIINKDMIIIIVFFHLMSYPPIYNYTKKY